MKVEIEVPVKLYFEDYHYISTVQAVIDSLGLGNKLEVTELDELDEGDYVFEIRERKK